MEVKLQVNNFYYSNSGHQTVESLISINFDYLDFISKCQVIYHLSHLTEIFAQVNGSADTSLRLLTIQLKQKLT